MPLPTWTEFAELVRSAENASNFDLNLDAAPCYNQLKEFTTKPQDYSRIHQTMICLNERDFVGSKTGLAVLESLKAEFDLKNSNVATNGLFGDKKEAKRDESKDNDDDFELVSSNPSASI